jgi:hypothetical protein
MLRFRDWSWRTPQADPSPLSCGELVIQAALSVGDPVKNRETSELKEFVALMSMMMSTTPQRAEPEKRIISLIQRLFDRDIIYDRSHGCDFLGEVSGPILLISRIDEAAQLNLALERFHTYSVVLILAVFCQRRLDAGRSVLIVNSLTRALLVATAGGAAGHAHEQWHCAEGEDQCEYF